MDEQIKVYAPVLIPTLNRYDHFKRCIESLTHCTHADKTELIIGLDYPPSEKYVEGWEMISGFIQEIIGFRKVTVIKREYNFGAVANYQDLIRLASRTYDRFIFSEDDNVFSPNFLDYVNKGLEKYKDDPRVFAVCGYNYPMDMTGYDKPYFFAHEISAWGMGRWVNKYEAVRATINEPGFLIKRFREQPLSFFLKNNTRMCNGISHVGYEMREDVYTSYYYYMYDKYSVFPTVSLVKNTGQDGSGLHSLDGGIDSIYNRQAIDQNIFFDFGEDLDVGQDEVTRKKIVRFFTNYHWWTILKRVFLLLLLRAFVKIRDFRWR